MEAQEPKTEGGLLGGLASLFRNGLALVLNRLELAGIEFGEMRNHFVKLLLLGAIGVVSGLLALGYWSALVVYLSWDSLGWKILLILAGVFTGLCYVVFRLAQAMLDSGQLSMPATMAELRKDRDTLL